MPEMMIKIMQHKGGTVRVKYIKLMMEAPEKIEKIQEICNKKESSDAEKIKWIRQPVSNDEKESKLEVKELEIQNPRAEDDRPKVESSVRRTVRLDLQEKGVVCKMDCVITVLTFVCYLKLDNVRLCSRYLENLIVYNATLTCKKKIVKRHLLCSKSLSLLKDCEIVRKKPKYTAEYGSEMNRNDQIDKAWEILEQSEGNAKVMIVARKFKNTTGHVIVCDLESKTEDNRLTFYDPQREEMGTGGKEDFREYLKDDQGIILESVNLEKLTTIINDNTDVAGVRCECCGNNDWMDRAKNMFNRT